MQKTRTVSCLALPCLPLPSPDSHLHAQRSRGAAPRVSTSTRICSNPDTCLPGTASEAAPPLSSNRQHDAVSAGAWEGMRHACERRLSASQRSRNVDRGLNLEGTSVDRGGRWAPSATNTKARPRCSTSKQHCPLSTIPGTGHPNSSVFPRVMQSRFTMRLNRAACVGLRDGGCPYFPFSCS